MHAYGYDESDFIPCEIQPCGVGVDIHHIEARGMGGSKTKDVPENLMAMCRKHHEDYGDITEFKDYLKRIHLFKTIINQPNDNQAQI